MGKFEKDLQLSYDDVLINPTYSTIRSRFSNDLLPYYENNCLPIVNAPMDSICSEKFINEAKDKLYVVFSHRFQTIEEQIKHIELGANGGVIGLTDGDDIVDRLIRAGAKHILLDVANGGNIAVIEKLKELQRYRKIVKLWAGNITHSTYWNIMRLCDYVRAGIGSGAACETSTRTAVGCGIISTILDCREIYDEWNTKNKPCAKIVADGGIKNNGDICKALVAGAHLVMVGKLFAGTYESAAPLHDINFKKYRGMASEEVNAITNKTKYSIEGVSGLIPVTGYTKDVLEQMESNLRSSMSYVDARTLKEYYKNGKFIKVTQSTYQTAQPQI